MPSPDLGEERIGNVPVMVASEVTDAAALSLLALDVQAQPETPDSTQATEGITNPNGQAIPDEPEADASAEPKAEETEQPAEPATEVTEVERTDGGKVLVIGSSSIALNSSFTNSPANLALLRNAIAWMAGETAQLNQGADDDAGAALQANALQVMLVWIVCVLIAPVFLLIGAINTWWSTRER